MSDNENLTFYQKVEKLTRILAKSDILLKTDFTCCNTCGGAEIDRHRKDNQTAYCFWHSQDQERIDEQLENQKSAETYLSWGFFDYQKDRPDDEYQELANKIKCAANLCEIEAETDGDINTRIKLKFNRS